MLTNSTASIQQPEETEYVSGMILEKCTTLRLWFSYQLSPCQLDLNLDTIHITIFVFTATTALASSTVRKDDEMNQEQTTKGDVGSHEEDDIDPTLVDDEGHRIKRGFLKGGGGSYAPPIITHYGPPPGAAAAAQAAHAAHQAQYAAQAAQQVIK